MHAIRFHLRAPYRPDGPPTAPPPPSPEAVRDGLARGLPVPARIEHARILTGPGAVDGVAFVLADDLLAAEAALTAACATLTGRSGPLPDWDVPHCALDTLLALGLLPACS
ncbi:MULTISPECIES: hypothetical protein [Kitasatospora]|uniref:Uncharacterized protein n=1 Tax=Kitasatospora cathayae TaxID=3004092 RepID=A0ABY7Q0F2_9ACTN|nr:hypothetical protein [Kitasatospora sp. HUAS 3-15]WBP86114.1 hypothetical protein O1G21_09855 [Kitasatospora sp. HUAS 3-15]